MTVSYEPVMELVRASLMPVGNEPVPRTELPACRTVLKVARSTEDLDGMHPIHDLAAAAGVAASAMTFWLAQERDMDPAKALERMPGEGVQGPVVDLLRTLMTGPTGMGQTAEWLMRLFVRDQEAYLDLIVELGAYTATCIQILDGLGASSVDQSLEDLEDLLRDYYGDSAAS
ncbi:hypothetical protein [Streptomyces sp. NPDC127112]|uniref:hypothetical protein n=1 Tax=Streptomyces sp. NPDC127112 TaxID=3345364 RepID=UPI00363DA00E